MSAKPRVTRGRTRAMRRARGGRAAEARAAVSTGPVSDVVVLRNFSTEVEAHLAAAVLEANGIAAQVLADTAGGTIPAIAVIFPVRLLVRARDADLARELLDTPVGEATGDE